MSLMSSPALIILALEESPMLHLIAQALQAGGFHVDIVQTLPALEKELLEKTPSVIAIGETLDGASGLELSSSVLERFPTLPVVLIANQPSTSLLQKAMRIGVSDFLAPPLKVQDIAESINRTRKRADLIGDWVRKEVRRTTVSLERRVHELETLVGLGRQITGSLDANSVLTAVVSSAVQLTSAEGGVLLLVSGQENKELYARASYAYNQSSASMSNELIDDQLAWHVINKGESYSCNDAEPQSILGGVQARSIIYVPLLANNRAFGLLGVYRSGKDQSFRDYDFLLMSVLADYAAIAIENSRLYQISETERTKLETTLNRIAEVVMVLDDDFNIIFLNAASRKAFELGDADLMGKSIYDVVKHSDFEDLMNASVTGNNKEHEISFEDGRIYTGQCTPVTGVGWAVTMQDVTNMKMVDRIKSDFIHTVSHDLRSPLTAILGYVELLERIGPLNDQQREFTRRVQASVQSITALVNDLLDLGRIEAGFDAGKDEVHLQEILRYTLDTLQNQITDKKLVMLVNTPQNLPSLRGNPIRLRQLVDNLVGNAVKYTPAGGNVTISMENEDGQVIFRISDTGVGIPLTDQPHIFEKFYRATNAPKGTPGTGLGLAIVKSIVDNHEGRIWVESQPGQGTTFYVVLPVFREDDLL